MVVRAFEMGVLLLGGLVLGFWQGGAWGGAMGAFAGLLTGFVIDLVRASRVLRWLRRLDQEGVQPPVLIGLWGDVVVRIRRVLRSREVQITQAHTRLQETLAAIQASPNGVTLLDAQGRIEWCNQMAAEHFGFDPQRDVMQLVGNLVRDPGFAAYLQAGDYAQDVVIAARRSTPARAVKVAVQLYPYGEGRKLLLSRDVTALELADTMRRDFVANVSHEIRTPLTVLAGFIETMQTLPLEAPERERYLALMAQQAQRMQALVNDLLTLSRLEGSPLPGMQEWIPLSALAAQGQEDGRALSKAQGRGHDFKFGDPPAMEVACAPSELQSAVSNLIGNAVRYTPPGGNIEVRWALLPDGSLEFSVADNGPGVAPEHLARLTERFYRVDRSRSRETGGTGLGLAIVKHVMQRHGGTLRIDSRLGQGSTFSLCLPARRVRRINAPAAAVASPATEGQ